jgi:ABC-type thiamine transport system ATPase subunit
LIRVWKRLPIAWALLAAEAVLVLRRHWGSLHPHSRRRMRELVAKSHGRPGNLTREERRELISHVRQLDLRGLSRDIGEVASPVRLPGRRKRRGR